MGAKWTTAVVSFIMAWKAASRTPISFCLGSSGRPVMAMPKTMQKKMSPSMSASAIALTTLVGTMSKTICSGEAGGVMVGNSLVAAAPVSRPMPGWIKTTRPQPSRMASRLVSTKNPRVLAKSRPRSLPPPIDAVPQMIEVSTSGTITMRRRRTKRVPSHDT